MGAFDDMFDSMPSGGLLDADSTAFEGVTVLQESAKAWLVRFPVNTKPKWVAKKQCRVDITAGTIEVTNWLLGKWEEEGFDPSKAEPGEVAEFPDTLCLRETAAALWVEIPRHGRIWIPKSQLAPTSEVAQDGDHGTLVVTAWIAREKKLIAESAGGAGGNALDDLNEEEG